MTRYAESVDDIAMYTFKDALKADGHMAYKGDIYCGMKRLPIIPCCYNYVPFERSFILFLLTYYLRVIL